MPGSLPENSLSLGSMLSGRQTRVATADGRPLAQALSKALRRARLRALLLVVPLLVFIVITFAVPVSQVLVRSFYDDTVPKAAPALTAWLRSHSADAPIDESAYEALAADLKSMKVARTAGEVGTRINFYVPGSRSLFTTTARIVDRFSTPYRDGLLAFNAKWGDPLIWQALRSASHSVTGDYFLTALDLRHDASGHIERVPEGRRIYLALFAKTFLLSGLIAILCLLLAFPVAHLLANLPPGSSNLLMILVLLPFWTSLLVRTSSWIVLLQNQGVVNELLLAVGLINEGGRLDMMYNKFATVVVMTHVLLPFMILPLYSAMRASDPAYVRAARSLGATSWTAFRRVYLPQTLPGISAGSLLVFILAIGYYVTPALVGGADGQLISNLIQFHMNNSNWALAAALSAMLLAGVLVLYWLYDRIVGIDKLGIS